MAIGLINKQIVHGTGGSKSPFMKSKNKQRLEDATANYDTQMSKYSSQNITNPYAAAKNQFGNLQNTMEDVTVNQQQAQFEAQQNQQSQANIMQSLQGAAGGSGVAGLAQSLANQGQIATQKASASIGRQESQNARFAAQQASTNQQLQAKGAQSAQNLRMSGAEKVQTMEMDKQATMLGMSMQQVGNAQEAIAANKAMWGQIIGGVASGIGAAAGGSLGKPVTNIIKQNS